MRQARSNVSLGCGLDGAHTSELSPGPTSAGCLFAPGREEVTHLRARERETLGCRTTRATPPWLCGAVRGRGQCAGRATLTSSGGVPGRDSESDQPFRHWTAGPVAERRVEREARHPRTHSQGIAGERQRHGSRGESGSQDVPPPYMENRSLQGRGGERRTAQLARPRQTPSHGAENRHPHAQGPARRRSRWSESLGSARRGTTSATVVAERPKRWPTRPSRGRSSRWCRPIRPESTAPIPTAVRLHMKQPRWRRE